MQRKSEHVPRRMRAKHQRSMQEILSKSLVEPSVSTIPKFISKLRKSYDACSVIFQEKEEVEVFELLNSCSFNYLTKACQSIQPQLYNDMLQP